MAYVPEQLALRSHERGCGKFNITCTQWQVEPVKPHWVVSRSWSRKEYTYKCYKQKRIGYSLRCTVFMDSEYILTVVGTVDNRVLLHSEIFGDPIVLKKILILMTTGVLRSTYYCTRSTFLQYSEYNRRITFYMYSSTVCMLQFFCPLIGSPIV